MKQIKEQFDKVLKHNVPIKDAELHTEPLFYKWRINKKNFIDKIGQKYIYEHPVPISIELSDENKKYLIDNFLDQCFFRHFKGEDYFGSFWDFVRENKKGFFDNIVDNDFINNNLNIKILKGSKFIKSFKYFMKEEELRQMQDKASQIIQLKKLEGILCLSVHPLDYLSISETAHNWKSCHSLDGCYAAGNLSYLCDNTTLVCYIRANEKGYDYNLPHFPEEVTWNSKKWRSLIHINPTSNMYFINKHYPYQIKNDELTNTINRILESLKLVKNNDPNWGLPSFRPIDSCFLQRKNDGNPTKRTIDIPSYVTYAKEKREISSIHDYINLPTRRDKKLFYCDLTESFNFKPNLVVDYRNYYEKIDFNVDVPCPVCGLEDLTHHGLMIGKDCMKLAKENADCTCYYCDEDKPIKNLIPLDGNLYCEDCYDQQVWECQLCGEEHIDYFYRNVNGKRYCAECLDKRKDDIINGN